MSEHDARLAPSALLGMVACALVVSGTLPWRATVGVLLLGVVGALVASRGALEGGSLRRARIRTVTVAVAFACATAATVSLGAGLRYEARSPPLVVDAIERGSLVRLEGTIAHDAMRTSPDTFTREARWWTRIEAHRIEGHAARSPIYVIVSDPQGIVAGASVTLAGRLSPALQARDAAVMWDARVIHTTAPATLDAILADSRDRFRELVEPLPVRQAALTAGMVIGDDSAMPPEQLEQMRRSGLAHLTAVSGAHFAVLALVTMWCVRRARMPRALQALAVGSVAVAFAMLVGPEASVVRAASMALVMATAVALGRRARAVAALASGVVVLLAVDPWVATSLGFCLSVAAVAAIAIWSPHLAIRLERWIVPRFAKLVAVPISAAVATAPLLVPVAGGVGTYVVAANLVAAPFAAPVTVIGLLALAVAQPLPWLAEVLVVVASILVLPVDAAARAFAGAPGAWLAWPQTPLASVSLAIIAALLVTATVSIKVRGWGLAAVALACSVAVSTPTLLTAAGAPRLPDWDIVACDVGQGDMMLLRSAPDSAVVIDVGPPGGGSAQCLRSHGVRRIDLLILTHPDADHDGDVAAVAAAVPIAHAWISPVATHAPSTRLLERYGVPITVALRGTEAQTGAVALRVLAPHGGSGGVSDNEASVVVLAQAGGASLLALGDLETDGQERLARDLPALLPVDVIKIAHHGSANQSEALAARLAGRVGIVSSGASNLYGHPHPDTLELYLPRVALLLRTDQCGDVLMAAAPSFRFASRCPIDVAG